MSEPFVSSYLSSSWNYLSLSVNLLGTIFQFVSIFLLEPYANSCLSFRAIRQFMSISFLELYVSSCLSSS